MMMRPRIYLVRLRCDAEFRRRLDFLLVMMKMITLRRRRLVGFLWMMM